MSEVTLIAFDVKKGPKDTETFSVIVDGFKAYEEWKANPKRSDSVTFTTNEVLKGKGHGISGDHASLQDLENTFWPLIQAESKSKKEGDAAEESAGAGAAAEGEPEEELEEEEQPRPSKKEVKSGAISYILRHGTVQRAQSHANDRNDRNIAGGGMRMDVRGSGAQMSGA